MRRNELLLLAIPPLLLCVTAAFGLQIAADLRARAGADSPVALIAGALNDASKLTPGHVRTVLGAAQTIEAIGVAAEARTADTVAALARGCLGIALVDAILIALVARRLSSRGVPPGHAR